MSLPLFPDAPKGDRIERDAWFSPDGKRRYLATRTVIGGRVKRALFVGVNPSLAGKVNDDHTVSKLYGFGERHGIRTWALVNKFDFISTDVRALAAQDEPSSPYNNRIINEQAWQADLILVAWGRLAKLPPRLRERWREVYRILDISRKADTPIMCLGTCADGQPCHPLMLSYETPMIPWHPPKP